MSDLSRFYKDRDVLVTGGCGSIGREIVRELLKFKVKRVRVLDHNESGLFYLQESLKNNRQVRTLVGDIRDRERLKRAVSGVDIVFHAAALKHVPLCEYNPYEAVATNVIGTQNLINTAREENVDRFIGISTDKAVSPINTMGATKLLSEKLVLNASMGISKTRFSCVRFGNVLNTDGSVISVFTQQIAGGGPVELTSDDMVRFFMTIEEAVGMILHSAMIMDGREIFILKMHALKIADLAEVMIEELAPRYNRKPSDIKIKIVGIRPGEKIYELLMTEEESHHVKIKDGMFVIKPEVITPHYIQSTYSKKIDEKHYDARRTKLLTKKQVRKLLYDSNII